MTAPATPTPGQAKEGKSLVDSLAKLFVVCGTDPRFALLREQVSKDIAEVAREATNDHDKALGLVVEACNIAGRTSSPALRRLEAELLVEIEREVVQPKVSKAPKPSKIVAFPTPTYARRGRRSVGPSTVRKGAE